jgi:NAD(P)-dependent dehydrogenase (short-subunit alcohol dehydrogenase family)
VRTGTVLVTGCSSGIGYAAARDLSKRGWRVIAAARRAQDCARLETELGVASVTLDLADEASVAACAARALEIADGRIDALFNNGAYGQLGAVEDLPGAMLRRQFEVNVIGGHELTRLLLPQMRARGSGRIVQCSSVLGLVVGPYRGAYCASKFALEALSDCLRLELAGSGISISLIEPGPIATNFAKTALANLRATIDMDNSVHRESYRARIAKLEAGGDQTFKLQPETVVEKLIHALESRRPKPRYFVTTPTYAADVMRRMLPTRMLDRILSGQ